jgi:hypothetical protein
MFRKLDIESIIDFGINACVFFVFALFILLLGGCSKPKWDETTKASCWDGPGALCVRPGHLALNLRTLNLILHPTL